MVYTVLTMNTPTIISRIFTLTGDSLETPSRDENDDGLVILYFDQNEDLILSINTNYSNTINVFFMGKSFGELNRFLPFVKTTELHTASHLEHITCVVPEGKNFFEEDFTAFNEYLGMRKTKDFKFSM